MDAYTTGNAKFVDEDYAAAIEVGGVLKATMPLWVPFHRQVNDVIVTIRNAIFLKNKKRENQIKNPWREAHTDFGLCLPFPWFDWVG